MTQLKCLIYTLCICDVFTWLQVDMASRVLHIHLSDSALQKLLPLRVIQGRVGVVYLATPISKIPPAEKVK